MSSTKPLVTVIPLLPFVGAYPCRPEISDYISSQMTEENGIIAVKKVAMKRFRGIVGYTKTASPADISDDAARVASGLPSRLVAGGQQIEFAGEQLQLPEDLATDLGSRGLCEIVRKPATRAPAAGAGR